MTETRWSRIVPIALILAAALAAVAPIRNYDFFWHLATGRWIVEHAALPLTDPFAIASERTPWINGEWLFEIVLYGLQQLIGITGMSWVRGLLAALIFGLAARRAAKESESHTALVLSAIAYAGAMQTFDVRPSSLALLFVALACTSSTATAHGVNAVLWMNIHPSAVIAPLIAALRTRRVAPVLASCAGLLVNPHGLAGILAPVKLTLLASSGQFVNAEWLPSPVALFPLLYACIALAAIAFLTNGNRREQWWRAALLAVFAYLAVRHVRNQGLFFIAFAVLVPPAVLRERLSRALSYGLAAASVAYVAFTTDHRLGIAPERFPLQAVARLRASGLSGNVYNPDQFGGLVIWAFYPQRRALTDGRNELYHQYIPAYARARRDERAWRALLKRYRIDLAVEEYMPPLEVRDAASGRTTSMAASLAFWPRKEWALIGFDRAAMVFARRAAFSPEMLERYEIKGVVPDAPR